MRRNGFRASRGRGAGGDRGSAFPTLEQAEALGLALIGIAAIARRDAAVAEAAEAEAAEAEGAAA